LRTDEAVRGGMSSKRAATAPPRGNPQQADVNGEPFPPGEKRKVDTYDGRTKHLQRTQKGGGENSAVRCGSLHRPFAPLKCGVIRLQSLSFFEKF